MTLTVAASHPMREDGDGCKEPCVSVLHDKTEMLFLHLLVLRSLKVVSITISGGYTATGKMNGHFKN